MKQEAVKQTSDLVEVLTDIDGIPCVYQIESRHLLPHTFIIESSEAMKILLRPWMIGASLANAARRSSVDFLRVAYHLVPELQDCTFENVAEVVPLAGALYYSMGEAFEEVFGETTNRCFIGARRHLTPSGWETNLSYLNFEALPTEPVILIGDTIATGGTLGSIVNAIMKQDAEVRAILIYSIAGGIQGAIRLKTLAEQMDVPIYCFYSNALFGVQPNGTDMPWLHPATITSKRRSEEAMTAYGPDLGRRWCCVHDWGDRAKNPSKHLEVILRKCEDELVDTQAEETRLKLIAIQDRTTEVLRHWKSALSPSSPD